MQEMDGQGPLRGVCVRCGGVQLCVVLVAAASAGVLGRVQLPQRAATKLWSQKEEREEVGPGEGGRGGRGGGEGGEKHTRLGKEEGDARGVGYRMRRG